VVGVADPDSIASSGLAHARVSCCLRGRGTTPAENGGLPDRSLYPSAPPQGATLQGGV